MKNLEESMSDSKKNWLWERKALRNTRNRNIHEKDELRRDQEMRVDEFSSQKFRESHATMQEPTSQTEDLQGKDELKKLFERI